MRPLCIGCNAPLDGQTVFTGIVNPDGDLTKVMEFDTCMECGPILINAFTILHKQGLLG